MPKQATPAPRHEALAALRQLMLKAKPSVDRAELAELSVAQLRDELLSCDPLNTAWVAQINRVSLPFGSRTDLPFSSLHHCFSLLRQIAFRPVAVCILAVVH